MRQHTSEQNAAPVHSIAPKFESGESDESVESKELEVDLEQTSDVTTQDNSGAVIRVKRLLEHEVYLRKRRGRFAFSWMTLWLMPIIVGAVTGRLADWIASLVSYPWLLILYYLIMVGPLLKLIWPNRKHLRQHTGSLSELDDVRLIAPLMDMLKIEDRRIRMRAGEALKQLLPRLQASDAHLLNAAQRAVLCRVLAQPMNSLWRTDLLMLFTGQTRQIADLQVAILQGFEQVGDGKALPVVERLAAGEATTADQQRVKAAAQECLPYLQARAAREQAHQTLLRASSVEETDPAILLRPAGAAETTDAEQLLRPDPDLPASSGPFSTFSARAKRLSALVLRHE